MNVVDVGEFVFKSLVPHSVKCFGDIPKGDVYRAVSGYVVGDVFIK